MGNFLTFNLKSRRALSINESDTGLLTIASHYMHFGNKKLINTPLLKCNIKYRLNILMKN